MKPINKYILIDPVQEEVKSESGLMLVGDEADMFRYKKATVVKAGTNVTDITDGDTIYYDKGAGYTMMFSGKKYTVILERDVVVVV
jgi:co-chaperonin GroES (HSP10)